MHPCNNTYTVFGAVSRHKGFVNFLSAFYNRLIDYAYWYFPGGINAIGYLLRMFINKF
ncbi:hypothetical protein GALL_511080 [mine drainage metagenome]|uniref:Uncharacterized protein n=1 Tax=mine drainage metagenome TaxID=410659 RepID=A0A1J5PPU4_9ZZZZ